jgi:hypothetical protein
VADPLRLSAPRRSLLTRRSEQTAGQSILSGFSRCFCEFQFCVLLAGFTLAYVRSHIHANARAHKIFETFYRLTNCAVT